MNRVYIALSLLALLVLSSCDDGRIYEKEIVFKEGRVVELTGTLKGVDSWASRYNVAIAGFNDESDYAVISKVIPAPDADGKVDIILSGIEENVEHIELCVLNRLRLRIINFKEIGLTSDEDTIRFDVGTVDVGMFSSIQQTVFSTTCANCHGASGSAASGLFLTEGNSYASLVNQPSTKLSGSNRVTPGDASHSALYLTLATDTSKTWRYTHMSEVTSSATLALIEDWIDAGAKE